MTQLSGASDPVVRGNPQAPALVGRHVLWQDFVPVAGPTGFRIRLAHGAIDRAADFYFEPAEGTLAHPVTDGVDWAWLQGYDRDRVGGDWARLELWTSPYREDPTELAPRLVRVFPSSRHGTMVIGDGLVAHFVGRTASDPYGIFDLSDGRVRLFPPPTGWGFDALIYVTETEALFGIHRPTGPYTVVRVDPRTLPYEDETPP